MKNLFLEADKFEGRLNMSIFTNIEKALNESEFKNQYPSGKFLVFEKSNVDAFISSVHEQVGGEIKKGGFNDTKEVRKYIEKAEAELSQLKPVNLLVKGEVTKVYVMEKPEEKLVKGEEDELNKGKVSEAFDFYQNGIVFSKKGSEIKTKAAGLRAGIEVQLEGISSELEEASSHLSKNPTREVRGYGFSEGVKCPYKAFDWNQTYFNGNSGRVAEYGEEAVDCCDSAEEAKVNSLYNDKVYQWLELAGELKAIEMYENNLEDKKVYDLTARQMIALGF